MTGATDPHRFLNPADLLPGRGFSHVALPSPGQLVHIAGQTAHQPDGSVQGDTISEQMDAALANLVTALEAAGAGPEHLVSVQLFVTDVAAYRHDLGAIGEAWQHRLGRRYPAVSLFGVTGLFDPAAMVEIVAIAVLPHADQPAQP